MQIPPNLINSNKTTKDPAKSILLCGPVILSGSTSATHDRPPHLTADVLTEHVSKVKLKREATLESAGA